MSLVMDASSSPEPAVAVLGSWHHYHASFASGFRIWLLRLHFSRPFGRISSFSAHEENSLVFGLRALELELFRWDWGPSFWTKHNQKVSVESQNVYTECKRLKETGSTFLTVAPICDARSHQCLAPSTPSTKIDRLRSSWKTRLTLHSKENRLMMNKRVT